MALAGKDISSLTSDAPSEATAPPVKTAAAVRQKLAPEKEQAPLVRKQPEPSPAMADIQSANIIREIHAMRQMLEEQLTTIGWSNFSQRDPGGMKVLRTLLNAGFSPLLSRHLLEKLPADHDFEQSLKKTIALLTLNL